MFFRRRGRILLLSIIVSSCKWGDYDDVTGWHEATKERILEQSELVADSISERTDTQTSELVRSYYYSGHLFRKEIVGKTGVVAYMVRYANDSNFSYCTEYCSHGYKIYEGIDYKHKPYGIATWYDCETGKITEQGVRYKFRKVGLWKMYDRSGNPVREIVYDKEVKLKSYPRLKE